VQEEKMSKNIIGACMGVLFTFFSVAHATNVSGVINTNTTWTTAGSPYIVTGNNLLVDTLTTLTIQPGVTVKLDSARCILVKGYLNAIGTATDSIVFTKNGTAAWARIWLQGGSSYFKYCRIENANSSAIYNQSADSLYIGFSTISNNSAIGGDGMGAGICNFTKAMIVHNTISNNSTNYAGSGGGIYNDGSAIISNNIISNNSVYFSEATIQIWGLGGGILNTFHGSVTIANNTITGNSALQGGGIEELGVSPGFTAFINNNTISNNSAREGGGIGGQGNFSIIGNTINNNTIISQGNPSGVEPTKDAGGSIDVSAYNGSRICYNTISETDTFSAINMIYNPQNDIVFRTNNISAKGFAFYVAVGGGNIDARYNYWNSVNTDTINAKIYDYFDDFNMGIAYYKPFLKAPFSDTAAPLGPLNLAANGLNPSSGTIDSFFVITWTNPLDASGVAEYYYKLLSPPISSFDTTGTFHASPDTILVPQGGSLYVWLVDSSGNMNYQNADSVLLISSAIKMSGKPSGKPVFSLTSTQSLFGTTINYEIPEKTFMNLTLYDISGRLVKSIYSGIRESGFYTAGLRKNEFTPGAYFIKIETAKRAATKEFVLLR
jgi:hypothetical protein